MLRHAAGYALAARGVDTRTLQAFMGHRSIANTVVYTAVGDRAAECCRWLINAFEPSGANEPCGCTATRHPIDHEWLQRAIVKQSVYRALCAQLGYLFIMRSLRRDRPGRYSPSHSNVTVAANRRRSIYRQQIGLVYCPVFGDFAAGW
jgi:integrase-like protein